MNPIDIQKKLRVKQVELNLTNEYKQRKAIVNQLAILKYKLEIEEIKDKIEQLQNS